MSSSSSRLARPAVGTGVTAGRSATGTMGHGASGHVANISVSNNISIYVDPNLSQTSEYSNHSNRSQSGQDKVQKKSGKLLLFIINKLECKKDCEYA